MVAIGGHVSALEIVCIPSVLFYFSEFFQGLGRVVAVGEAFEAIEEIKDARPSCT